MRVGMGLPFGNTSEICPASGPCDASPSHASMVVRNDDVAQYASQRVANDSDRPQSHFQGERRQDLEGTITQLEVDPTELPVPRKLCSKPK